MFPADCRVIDLTLQSDREAVLSCKLTIVGRMGKWHWGNLENLDSAMAGKAIITCYFAAYLQDRFFLV